MNTYSICSTSGWTGIVECVISYVPLFMPVFLLVLFIIMFGWLSSRNWTPQQSIPSILFVLIFPVLLLWVIDLVSDRELFIVVVGFFASFFWSVYSGNKGTT